LRAPSGTFAIVSASAPLTVTPSAAPARSPALAIERGKTLLLDLVRVRAAHVELVAGPELLGSKFLGAPAQAGGDIRAVEAQLLAVSVDPADDDVRVRMSGVVVVDRGPFVGGHPDPGKDDHPITQRGVDASTKVDASEPVREVGPPCESAVGGAEERRREKWEGSGVRSRAHPDERGPVCFA
jgi:hypothetical protein